MGAHWDPSVLSAEGLGDPGGGTAMMPGGPQYASPPPWAEGCGVGAISFRKQSRKGPGGGRGGPVGSTPTSVAMMQKGLFGAGGAHVVTLPPPPPQCHISILVPKCPPAPPQWQPHCVQKVCIGTKTPFWGGRGRGWMGGGAHMGWDEGPHSPRSTEGGGSSFPAPPLSATTPNPFSFGGGASPPKLCFFWGGGTGLGSFPPPPHTRPPPTDPQWGMGGGGAELCPLAPMGRLGVGGGGRPPPQ